MGFDERRKCELEVVVFMFSHKLGWLMVLYIEDNTVNR